MVGRDSDPGLMVLSFLDLFNVVSTLNKEGQQQIDITCSYLEIYNEVCVLVVLHRRCLCALRNEFFRSGHL